MNKLSKFLLILVIVLIITIIGLYRYVIKISKDNLESTLNDAQKVYELNVKIQELEDKIDELEKEPEYKILGTYNAERPYGTEAFVYIFSEKSVIFGSDAYSDGSYEIEGDKIKITYTITHSPDDYDTPMYPVKSPEELTILDENTLIDSTGEKYYKTSDKTTIE